MGWQVSAWAACMLVIILEGPCLVLNTHVLVSRSSRPKHRLWQLNSLDAI